MFELKKQGQLLIDKVFFEANYPILFTCVNDKHELFLAVCCQNNIEGKRWLITKTDEKVIIEMLKNKRSIRESFLVNPEVQITIFQDQETIVSEHDEKEWGEDSIYLPKKGEYIDAEPEEFDEEIAYYESKQKEKIESSLSISYSKIFNQIQTMYNMIADDECSATIPEEENSIIISSVKRVLNVCNDLYLEDIEDFLQQYYFDKKIKEEVTPQIKYSDSKKTEKMVCKIGIDEENIILIAA